MTTIHNPIGWANRTEDVVPMKTVALTEALALAYAAYRINNETSIKDTRRFSCEENKTQFDNKTLVRFYWEKKLDNVQAKFIYCTYRSRKTSRA